MRSRTLAVLLPLVLVALLGTSFAPAATGAVNSRPSTPRAVQAYGKIPLHFEANAGETDSQVRFLARGTGYSLFLTTTEAVLALRSSSATPDAVQSVLRMKLVRANPKPEITALDPVRGRSNYYFGKDPKEWRSNVPQFARVCYQNVYPGVDLIYYGNQRQLEYDLVVAPGADPKAIRLRFEGATQSKIDKAGNLIVKAGSGELSLHAPVIYQESKGARRHVAGGYVLTKKNEVAFQITSYDRSQPLTIDPVLVYSTFLGGSVDDWAETVAADSAGNVYIAGWTDSPDFPSTGGSFQPGHAAYVTKLNSAGSQILYSTLLGGSVLNSPNAIYDIALDSSGNAYVTGAGSVDFPTTPGVIKPTCHQGPYGRCDDVFVAKLDPNGSLLYSTFLGGSGEEGWPFRIAVDSQFNAYVGGSTSSLDFPTTAGAFRPAYNGGFRDIFLAKLNTDASALEYATYLGGNGDDRGRLAVDDAGSAYIGGTTDSTDFPLTGREAFCPAEGTPTWGFTTFITKLNTQGSVVYSTHVCATVGIGDIAVDSAGNAYVTGYADPMVPILGQISANSDRQRIFAGKLMADGSAFKYAVRFGGSDGQQVPTAMAIDNSGNAYVAGMTNAKDFPVVNPIQSQLAFGFDAFVTKLNAAGDSILFPL